MRRPPSSSDTFVYRFERAWAQPPTRMGFFIGVTAGIWLMVIAGCGPTVAPQTELAPSDAAPELRKEPLS